jgi:hypothetical protein
MFNQPTTNYSLSKLCSISIGHKTLIINLHHGFFNVKTVESLLERLDSYTRDREYLTLINCHKSAKTTIQSLKKMAEPRAMKYAVAKAYVIQSLHQKTMANIFLFLFRPRVPVKFFRSEIKAKEWLSTLFFI